MPTGYTSIIDDNHDTTFEEFVWRCARAFGAFVMMREEPLDAPIPEEFQPSPYYRERVTKAEEALRAAEAMTLDEAGAALAAKIAEVNAYNEESLAKHAALAAAYREMVVRVAAWTPPSSEHARLREFMLEQLETGGPGSRAYLQNVPTETRGGWKSKLVADAEKELGRAREALGEEEERTRQRNEWVRVLRSSVPPPKNVKADA